MDRSKPKPSNDLASTSNSRSASSVNPFAYQTRLLERTSSLSRSNSLSNRFPPPNGPASSSVTRKWDPKHRLSASTDTLRIKWEERIKAEHTGDNNILPATTNSQLSETSDITPVIQSPTQMSSNSDTNNRHRPPSVERLFSPESDQRQISTRYRTSPSLKRHSISVTSSSSLTSNLNQDSSPYHLKGPQRSSTYSLSPASQSSVSLENPSSLGFVNERVAAFSRNNESESTELPVGFRSLNETSHLRSTFNPIETSNPTRPHRLPSSPKSEEPIGVPNSPSVMSPAPYRSSFMNSRKSNTYGRHLGSGHKLGRHLPRIASGDGNDYSDKIEETKDRGEEERERTSQEVERLRERQERRRKWDIDHGRTKPEDLSPIKTAYNEPELSNIGNSDLVSTEDVQGLRGRRKLLKSSTTPKHVPPLPTARLLGGSTWADTQRHLLQAYEYLCHVGEAQQWIEGCLGEELGFGVVEMEEALRNGVVLAKLVRALEGDTYVRRIYEAHKLDFRHSDNINHFFNYVRRVGLPEGFIFELTDLYNKKNIPKVIYCIHALSHLLARRGKAQRIGNLLGRLQFSDDQLQQTQQGLTAAGVQMPNFSNVRFDLAKEINEEPEDEPEPEEAEEEIRDRLLLECEESIIMLQSSIRGYLLRRKQTNLRERLRLGQHHITKIQARCRAHLLRKQVEIYRERQASLLPWVIALQAAARRMLTLRRWRQRQRHIRSINAVAIKVQAQIRGLMIRRRFSRLRTALRACKPSVLKLQSFVRAKVVRKTHTEVAKTLHAPPTMHGIMGLQAACRGFRVRRSINEHRQNLQAVEKHITDLQGRIRALLVRRRVRNQLAKLDDVTNIVIRLQAAARAYLSRKRLLNLIRGLRKVTPAIIQIQALARARMASRTRQEIVKKLSDMEVIKSVNFIQAFARASLIRNRHREQQKELDFIEPNIVRFQAAIRGALIRCDYIPWRDHLRQSHPAAIHLQSLFRGLIERTKFQDKINYYRANLSKVVKIQSLFRAKETREQYRQLTLGKNVTVGTIKNFVHLLDDSEADFQDEIELERLRKKVVESIRENQHLETELNDLDVKIALVVQNVKSFEELVKIRRHRGADTAAAHAARASVLAAHGDPFASSHSLDHTAKRKLELYQQLFYLLQSRGEYLARLFFHLTHSEAPEKSKRSAERIVLTLFGYGQDRREEYLLLKLFQLCIREEVRSAKTMDEILNSHPMYMAIAVHYVRPKQISYVREALQKIIREVVEQEDLDLETDPAAIYRAKINIEEMRSGKVSKKSKDVSYYEAVDDPDTRAEFIRHLQLLQAFTRAFLDAIISSTKKMPYGMQSIAREIFLELKARFPNYRDEQFATYMGRVIFYRFINPAIVTPETFDIVSTTIKASARRNLAEISKILIQIASGKLFGDDSPCLTPINTFVESAIQQFSRWFIEVADVADAETQFHAHEFLDVTVQPKPVYISPNEVYAMHTLLLQNLDKVVSARDDPVRMILMELDGVPNLGSDELNDARDSPINLELSNRFALVKALSTLDPLADEKALWVQCKRGVLAILRVQPAKDLIESLFQPVEDEHEFLWEDIVEHELRIERKHHHRMPTTTGQDSTYRLDDIGALSFRDVKANAISYLLQLEKTGKITRSDGYQGILNAIASDVRSKHRKRLERQKEIQSMQEAKGHLAERKKTYEEQINSYHNYIETAMNTMQRGKGKKRFVIPFTKQYFHLRELQKTGKSPQFGSFRYSAQDLYDKGILLSIEGFSPRQFDRIDIVIFSNEVGVFTLELHNNNTTGSSQVTSTSDVRMEDLLQAQFENRVSFPLFDGLAKFNLNLLLYQINKNLELYPFDENFTWETIRRHTPSRNRATTPYCFWEKRTARKMFQII